jgi:predicted nucleic acid-binding protein
MHFDASGILHAWDEYPIDNFPKFWQWIESEIRTGRFRISQVAFEEVGHKYPECATWLKEKGIKRLKVTNEVLVEAERIKELLEIEEEAYGAGVDENDLLIIAAARIEGETLLTQENRQPFDQSRKKKNYKIPTVCGLVEVAVHCQNVRELIQSSGKTFG